MALVSKLEGTSVASQGPQYQRDSDASAANTALSVSTPTGRVKRLLLVICKYSATPTQAGVTCTLDSGRGAAYDTVLDTGTANAQVTVFKPTVPYPLMSDDCIKVDAPAGGATITSQVTILTEVP
jgi:hypothetical protein